MPKKVGNQHNNNKHLGAKESEQLTKATMTYFVWFSRISLVVEDLLRFELIPTNQ